MGFTELLTLIFIVLKVLGIITWSWRLVLLPEIVAFGIYLIVFIVSIVGIGKTHKTVRKHFRDFDF